jgi:toxin YoeB
MEIVFTPKALAHLDQWQRSGNTAIKNKIGELLQSIRNHPFIGIGKPEPLKHELSGKWSRRINLEHRIIYDVQGEKVNIYSLRGHY